MNIFVAYGFNKPRDKWIEEMVFPIIEAFGSKVVTGEKYGESINENVRSEIARCDALIGFTTERVSQPESPNQTYQWVVTELAAARMAKKWFLEVREIVSTQGGLHDDFPYINYAEKERDRCLVKIVEVLGDLHNRANIKIQLLPKGWADKDLRPLLDSKNQGVTCSYEVWVGNEKTGGPFLTDIKQIKRGLFIDMPRVRPEETIQVTIQYGERRWVSGYESMDTFGIHLNLEASSRWQRLMQTLGI
jgi:hypothetical protein